MPNLDISCMNSSTVMSGGRPIVSENNFQIFNKGKRYSEYYQQETYNLGEYKADLCK